MRTTAIILSFGFLLAAALPAAATTCADLSKNCMRNGGTKAKCYAPQAVAHCKKTCEMIGPYTGRSFYANKGCGKK